MPDFRGVTLPSNPRDLARVLGVSEVYVSKGADAIKEAAHIKNAIAEGGDIPVKKVLGSASVVVNVIPGVGQVASVVLAGLSALASFIGISIRGRTKHPTWEEANKIAQSYANKFHTMFFSKMTVTEQTAISTRFWQLRVSDLGGARYWSRSGMQQINGYTTMTRHLDGVRQRGGEMGTHETLWLAYLFNFWSSDAAVLSRWLNGNAAPNEKFFEDEVRNILVDVVKAASDAGIKNLRGENYNATPECFLNPEATGCDKGEGEAGTKESGKASSNIIPIVAGIGLLAFAMKGKAS